MDSKKLLKYQDKWVAFSFDRTKILASANEIDLLDKKIKKMDVKEEVIYHYVRPMDGYYSP